MAGDHRTMEARFETVTKWQTVCLFLFKSPELSSERDVPAHHMTFLIYTFVCFCASYLKHRNLFVSRKSVSNIATKWLVVCVAFCVTVCVCVCASCSVTSARESTMKAPLQLGRFAYCHRKSNALQLTYKMAHLIPSLLSLTPTAAPVLVCTSLLCLLYPTVS